VWYQQLGYVELLCPLVHGQGVISRHYQHVICPEEEPKEALKSGQAFRTSDRSFLLSLAI
jgi:hypothetical protein